MFYSAQDDVTIAYDDTSFVITEHIALGINDKTSYYPLEKLTISFFDNGYYKMDTEMLFEPPQYNRKMLYHIYNSTLTLLRKIEKNIPLTERENKDIINIPSTLMICYLNDFEEAKQKLIEAKNIFKKASNSDVYATFKEAMRVLRKMKYN